MHGLGPHWHAWTRTALTCVATNRIDMRGHDRSRMHYSGPHGHAQVRTAFAYVVQTALTNVVQTAVASVVPD